MLSNSAYDVLRLATRSITATSNSTLLLLPRSLQKLWITTSSWGIFSVARLSQKMRCTLIYGLVQIGSGEQSPTIAWLGFSTIRYDQISRYVDMLCLYFPKARTEDQQKKVETRLLQRQKERKRKIAEAGIEYDFDTVAYVRS